jgi:hypothetical protein
MKWLVPRRAGGPNVARMTATEIGTAVLVDHGVTDASKEDVPSVALSVQHSLKNHEGKESSASRELVRLSGN